MKKAIIVGAGPAGLTAAYELLTKTDIHPIVLEKSNDLGGISKTVVHAGNRIDIGGHRFFSKSDTVMAWWKHIMPIQSTPSKDDLDLAEKHPDYQNHKTLDPQGVSPETTHRVMLLRHRISRIFFLRKFFDYPVSLSKQTMSHLGVVRIVRIGVSYLWVKLFPRKTELSLEDFFINRFGFELYRTFFKDYTEKVWGAKCADIAADWGAQRIKELSVFKTMWHAAKLILKGKKSLDQKNVSTSLIGQFLYPKLGPGSMWETVAELVKKKGGEVRMNCDVVRLDVVGKEVRKVVYQDRTHGKTQELSGDYFFSTMPVKELIQAMGESPPTAVRRVAKGLEYRDFITVGLLLNKLEIQNTTDIPTPNNRLPDHWIYIQEREVKVGRLQIFNNWSPYMVKDPNKVWIGSEYFCYEGDELWEMEDQALSEFAIDELHKIAIIDKKEVLDSVVVRMPKAYPAYFGAYAEFDVIRNYTDALGNLFLIGRNGMHKYNNADHSVLTAITAVENIRQGITSKANIWQVNTEKEYHEERK